MKIGILGGAGVRTVIFIHGLIRRSEKLGIDEVVLYDINRDKQEIIGKLCRYVAQRDHGKFQVRWVARAEEAIRGMDAIVTTLRVGGDHGRVMDEDLALKRGVIGQETTGVGGFSMAVRTIPVLLDYMERIQREAPEAWVFNFTNPSGLVTQALHERGYHRVIGICDAPSSMKYRMAQALKVPEEELYTEFFGLNHLSWIRSVRLRGREIMPELIGDDGFLREIQELSVFDPRVIRRTGLLPNEYLYYYYHREKALENMKATSSLRGRTIERVNREMFRELEGMDLEAEPEEALQAFLWGMQLRENSYMTVESGGQTRPLKARGTLPVPEGMGYAGVMLDCIEGMQSREGKSLVLSVLNGDSLPFLDRGDVVEMTCHVSQQGIEPVKVSQVPDFCRSYILRIKEFEKLTVEAVMRGSRDLAWQALALHPLVNSWSLADALLGDLEACYGTGLPWTTK